MRVHHLDPALSRNGVGDAVPASYRGGTSVHHERRLGTPLLHAVPRQRRIQVVDAHVLPARAGRTSPSRSGRCIPIRRPATTVSSHSLPQILAPATHILGSYLVPEGIEVDWIRTAFDGAMPRRWEPSHARAGGWWPREETRIVREGKFNDDNVESALPGTYGRCIPIRRPATTVSSHSLPQILAPATHIGTR
jgi:hypothetical protein